jgi:hypothetical protein
VRAAVEDDAAVGADEVGEARGLAALVAEAALERGPDSLVSALGLENPRLGEERRPVAHVPLVAARELRDPVALCILVEAHDRPLHEFCSTRLITLAAQGYDLLPCGTWQLALNGARSCSVVCSTSASWQ